MIASALNYSAEQLTYLISTDIFMCGVATFLQLQLRKHFGVGLPVVLVVPSNLLHRYQSLGLNKVLVTCLVLIISGIYVILISGIFSKIADFFHRLSQVHAITTIGLTLIPVAIGKYG